MFVNINAIYFLKEKEPLVLLLFLLKLCLMTLVWLYLQDPGWLMGVRKINNQKGVFPENFTKPV